MGLRGWTMLICVEVGALSALPALPALWERAAQQASDNGAGHVAATNKDDMLPRGSRDGCARVRGVGDRVGVRL